MLNRSENKINCIFIRHGCTVSNREHRYLGRTDEPLDEAGVFELKNALNNGVYKALEENSLKEQIIITSPMRRCKQTAEIILPPSQQNKIHTVKEFAEMDFGEWELKNYKELSTDIRFRDSYQAWIDSGGTLAFPGGESREAFIARCVDGMELVMEQIRQQLAYRACPKCRETEDNGMIQEPLPVAAVVHGGTIMALLSHYCGGDYFSYQVKNAEGYHLRLSLQENKMELKEKV